MNIGLDGQSLQALQHVRDGKRLADLLSELESRFGSSARFLDSLKAPTLAGLDVILLTTRLSPVSNSEQEDLLRFVEHGGGLVVLSNHGDWPSHNPHDLTQHDRAVAQLFGVSVNCTWFRTLDALTCVSGNNLNTDHPILAATGAAGHAVESIVFNNCSAVTAATGDWIARIPSAAVDERGGLSPDGRAFAVAVPFNDGRVVVMADSGFIGSPGSLTPGPGLLDQGSNCLFITNAIRWAAGRAFETIGEG